MAVVSICSKMPHKGQVFPVTKLIRQCDKGATDDYITFQSASRCSCTCILSEFNNRLHVLHHPTRVCMKAETRHGPYTFSMMCDNKPESFPAITEVFSQHKVYNVDGPFISNAKSGLQRNKLYKEYFALETGTNAKQLKALDSYFGKLHNEVNEQDASSMPTSNSETLADVGEYQIESSLELPDKMIEVLAGSGQVKTKRGLVSLDDYFVKLNPEPDPEKNKVPAFSEQTTESNERRKPHPLRGDHKESSEKHMSKLKSYMSSEGKGDRNGPLPFDDENLQGLQPYDETSDLYLISILASLNIAVFLFEIATPVRHSGMENLSLPLIYGAKINELILSGEWWRLVTPMFLHSGFLHVAFGCWVLLTFGPQVCRGYGSFTFFLIYVLGGIAGNLSSFVHTSELTVGGTGPVFAILGAWFIYQIQYKVMISKEESESMFQKALITMALSLVLSNFEQIDDWTHLGAACAGLLYGFLICPTRQLDNASSTNGQEEGIAIIRQQPDPCKSVIMFSFFIFILSFLFFLFEPQLDMLELDSFV